MYQQLPVKSRNFVCKLWFILENYLITSYENFDKYLKIIEWLI